MTGTGAGEERTASASRAAGGRALGALYRALTALGAGGGRISHGVATLLAARDCRDDLAERLSLPSHLDELPDGALWIHAASVGEVRSVAPLARELARLAAGVPQLVTTSTPTGRRVARDELGLPTRLAPWDSTGPVERFVAALRPRLHVSVETEIWPLRLGRLAAAGVPSALVGARLSEERWPLYRRLAGLYAPALSSFALVSPTGPEDRDRLIALGVDQAALRPGGSLKWDSAPDPPGAEETDAVRRELGLDPGTMWIVLGSVHPGEAGALTAAILAGEPKVGVVVAPRHPRRFDAIALELARTGHSVHRASSGPSPSDARIVLLDRLGVLPLVYPLATAAVVGGTFVDIGGHSPLEAAAAACPLLAGPHIHKQRELILPLSRAGALVQVADAGGAGTTLRTWLADPDERRRRGDAARAEVVRHRGQAARLARSIAELLT
ncbi:MAG: hypothetical protein OEQ13_01150 [Acidobacteriota bacterium]|nr:hypothetical protein [Acidobacteriota bacterium]